jgi:hypothetical protein
MPVEIGDSDLTAGPMSQNMTMPLTTGVIRIIFRHPTVGTFPGVQLTGGCWEANAQVQMVTTDESLRARGLISGCIPVAIPIDYPVDTER